MSFYDETYGRQVIKASVLGTPVELLQIKATKGQLVGLTVQNLNAAARWAYVIDSASTDAGNIIAVIALAIGGSGVLFPMYPIPFLLGCKVHSSDTAAFHASGSNDLNVMATFI